MPKSLHIHSNERIDLPDFELAANGYSHSLRSHQIAKAMLDKHSRVLSGFRIELADQATSPGQLTVLAGLAYDKSGAILDIEDQPDASLTTTLAGASQTFYLEVEFTESASDLDSRGFWDPTVDQTSPIPDGGEVLVSVSTRKTPSWKIVSPISTTGFTYLSLPNSTRIPIAVLNTDASNQIDPSVNLFSSLEYPSTVTVSDYVATDTVLSVVDSHLFPIGSVITVDLGGTSPEVGRTVINNDLENHVLTVSPALATSHLAGAIIRRTDAGTDTLVPEQTDPNAAAYAAVTPATRPNDYRKRFFSGDEKRGSGLLKSANTFGTRDDLKIKSEKDQTDFIAALLRDLKFGSPRADSINNTPPIAFSSTPRYYDSAGSISGAKNNTISIGNGTTTFGDLNGTTDAVFTSAVNFLASNGGGTVYIKKGTYVFTNQVTVPDSISVHFVGEDKAGVVIENDRAADAAFVVSDSGGLTDVSFENVTTTQTGGSVIFLSGIGSYKLTIKNSIFTGISTVALNKFNVEDSILSNANSFATLSRALMLNTEISGTLSASTLLAKSCFINCKLNALTAAALQTTAFLSCEINNVITVSVVLTDVVLENCSSQSTVLPGRLFNITGASTQRLSIINCKFYVIGTNIFTQASGTAANISVHNCDFRSVDVSVQTMPLFDFSNVTTLSSLSVINSVFVSPMTTSGPVTSAFRFANVANVVIQGCSFSTAGSLSTSSTNVVRTISFVNSVNSCIRDCTFTQATTTEFTQGIYSSGAADLTIDNCSFTNGYSALTAVNASTTVDQITVSNCAFNHSAAIDYTAINLSGSQILNAIVKNSTFNYGGISGVGLDKSGILFASSQSNLLVNSCSFYDFGVNSTAGTFGIYITSDAISSNIVVNNNTFADFNAPQSVSGVNIIAPSATVSCSHNTFVDFSVGTGNVINIFRAETSILAGNMFSNCNGAGNLVRHRNCVSTKLTNNSVSESVLGILFHVLVDSGLTTKQDINITANDIINDVEHGDANMTGIFISVESFTSSVICSNNSLYLDEGLNGISISGTSTNLRNVVVSGNSVQLTGTGRAIIVDQCARGTVSNNMFSMGGTPSTGILSFTTAPSGIGTCIGNVCNSGSSPSPLAIICAGNKIIMAYNITNTFDSNTSTSGTDVGNI